MSRARVDDVLLRRESSCADLTITSTPVTPRGVVDFDLSGARTELVIAVGAGGEVTASATMRRGRKAIHEEVWAQLFVDDVFVDVVRTAEIDHGDPEPSFVAHFAVPPLHIDGELHRARVCFMTRLSRSSSREDVENEESGVVATSTQGPEASAEADFRATRRALRSAR